MVKHGLVFTAILGGMASSALGAAYSITMLAPVTGGTTPNDTTAAVSVSEDGLYIAGRSADPFDGLQSAGVYNVSTGTWTLIPETVGTGPALTGIMTGAASRGGPLYAAGNANDDQIRGGTLVGTLYAGATNTTTRLSGLASASDAVVQGLYPADTGHSVAAFADGSDAWVVGIRNLSAGGYNFESYIYKASAGGAIYATGVGRMGTPLRLSSVSSIGRAVGWDHGLLGGGRSSGVYVDAGAGGTMVLHPIGKVPGYDSSRQDSAWGISDNGNYITGFQSTTANTRPQGYLWKVGDAQATLLPGLDGTTNNINDQSYCADVANDGTVVGYSSALGVAPAASIWFPGATRAYRLYDVAKFLGIDMTAWSSSTLLNSAASSIKQVGDKYYITGTALYETGSGYVSRGYLLIIPEPASLALLAFGGLMLRRRRAVG